MNARRFYEAQAKALIKQLREDRSLSYKELARRLQGQGVVMDDKVLNNRINRGGFSFAFALQLLAAMEVYTLKVPRLPRTASDGPK